ncbi:MAG: glycosyltransferase [bacterium]|nr:glycosyltransferase [bacterium]
MSSLRVLHVIPSIDLAGGGANRACTELCEALAFKGIRVALRTVEFDPGAGRLPTQGVDAVIFPRSGPRAFSWGLTRSLMKEVRQYQLVHIHALWMYPNIPAAVAAKIAGLPYVVSPHGSLEPWKLRFKGLRKRVYGALVEKRILEGAAAIIAGNGPDLEAIKTYVPSADVRIVPYGAHLDAITRPISREVFDRLWPKADGRRVVLYLGRLDRNKGVDLLIRAFSRLPSQFADVLLLIVGPDSYNMSRSELLTLAADLCIQDRVRFTGMVTEEEKLAAYEYSDIYVLPSLSENFGYTVLESLARGTPVLISRALPWPEVPAERAGLVVQADVGQLVEGLIRLLSLERSDLRAMGERGRAIARRYDSVNVADRIMRVYESVLRWPRRGTRGRDPRGA